jgi:hypothetical protein
LVTVGILLFVLGIACNALFMQMHVEGIIHDLSRLAALVGIALFILGAVKGKSKKS